VVFPNSSSGREDGTLRAAKSGEVPGTIDYTMNRADVTRILRNAKNNIGIIRIPPNSGTSAAR